MRTKTKNTIAILLSAVMMVMTAFVLMPQMSGSVYADDPSPTSVKCGDNLTWAYDAQTGVLTISGEGDMYDYTYDDWDQETRPWDRLPVGKLIVSEGVTGIGEWAFMEFGSLQEVDFPPSLKRIGAFAFQSCDLRKVVIPESVTDLGAESFRENPKLNDIEIKANIKEILPWTFAGCGATNVVISSDSIVRIGDAAFYGCQGSGGAPAQVTLPSKLREIGAHAFEFANIKHIDLPDTLTTIEEGAFFSCSDLEDIEIPSSVTSIGDNAFVGCDNMQKVVVPDGIVINIGGSSPAIYLLSPASCDYNGKAQTPSLTIKDRIGDVIDPSNYDLSYANNINAGTATVKVVFKGTYTGSKTLKFTINKTANTVGAKGKTVKLRASKLAKKKQTIKPEKAILISDAQGAVSYEKVSVTYTKDKLVKMSKKALKKYKKQAAKKITINAGTGKITLKKGLKKGTYKVTVNVKAAGDDNYEASAWKTATFKIRVK